MISVHHTVHCFLAHSVALWRRVGDPASYKANHNTNLISPALSTPALGHSNAIYKAELLSNIYVPLSL
jgi:hypothetical protein